VLLALSAAMRSISIFLLPVAVAAWPWPWSNKTTTPAPSAVGAFEQGVAKALGFSDVTSCFGDSGSGVTDMWDAVEDYVRGGYVSKAKAFAKFSTGLYDILKALTPCSSSMTDASSYKKLLADLKDSRYYTIHNGLTLALNAAEDHSELSSFATAWKSGDYSTAGYELMYVTLDILENPGIPSSNGTEALQIAEGLASGFASDINFTCFSDLSVEVPAIIGGVIDVSSVALILPGLESIFHGVEGLVPCYKACMADKTQMVDLLHEFSDFAHPKTLAEAMVENIKDNSIDISLEVASAILAYKGEEWNRVGLEVGKILGKIVVSNTTATAIVV
jgi:hypothetical protein